MNNQTQRDSAPSGLPAESEKALQDTLLQVHPNTADLVLRFATALARKLGAAEAKYGYGDSWSDDHWRTKCETDFVAHVCKGDPRDVAAYCAFMWHHGWSTPAVERAPGEAE